MNLPPEAVPIAGASGAAFRKVHLQRLMAFGLAVALSTLFSWGLIMSSWTTRLGPGRLLGDLPWLLVAAVCHGLASFSRHPLFDAAAPTSYLPPGAGRALTVVVAHAFVGMSLGLCAWKMVVARADANLAPKLADGSGALGGLVAGGAFCSAFSAVSFLWNSKYHLRFGLPLGGVPMSSFLWDEISGSLRVGLIFGAIASTGYLVLRCLGELVPESQFGRVLALLLDLPATPSTGFEGEVAGPMLVAYLVFLSSVANFSLHTFLAEIMNAIVVAPQDFVALWQANAAAFSLGAAGKKTFNSDASIAPTSPAVMLLDALSVGHEAVLCAAEKNFLKERGDGGGGAWAHKRGSMYDWTEEVELQRRALALALSANEMAGRSGREPPAGVPVWAQVARVQALQSIALMAPTDRDLRAALYEVNIVQVLRTLCLELDTANLLAQKSSFRKDSKSAERLLGCEGRGDVQWLAQQMASATSSACSPSSKTGRRWVVHTLKDGFTPPFRDSLAGLLLAVWRLLGGARSVEGAGEQREDGLEKPTLSLARVRSAIWAAQGISALMLNAPGESRVLSLDAMLPAVLGSLAGLLLAVQPPGRETSSVEPQGLALVLETSLSEVAIKYRSCLPDFRFPAVYAETINRLCA